MNVKALYTLSYGLYAIGALDKGRQVGCIVNTVVQITSEPKIIAVSINKDNYTNTCISDCKMFTVSVLSEDTSPETIGVLGFSTSSARNKYDELAHFNLDNNLPVLKDAVAYLSCKLIDSIDVHTHTIFLAEVIDGDMIQEDAAPMTYAYYHRVLKGKAPKNAPTYRAEEEAEKQPSQAAGEIYVCTVCGYEYDEHDEGTPFEELPDTWVCPICGAPKDQFEKK